MLSVADVFRPAARILFAPVIIADRLRSPARGRQPAVWKSRVSTAYAKEKVRIMPSLLIDKMKKISRKKPAVSHLLLLCLHPYSQQVQGITKQGTALTGRNTTGPPSRAAPWWITLHMRRRGYVTDDDDDRRRRTKQYWPPYTMCRRASK